jgi:hypothetical protein
MGSKPREDRTPEEKWQIVQEGMKSGNVSETCRRYGIAQTLYYRCKDEAEQGAEKLAVLGEDFWTSCLWHGVHQALVGKSFRTTARLFGQVAIVGPQVLQVVRP